MAPIAKVIIYRTHQFFRWLLQQEGTPGQRARGLAFGVFSGCFPLFGFQTVLGITLARLFRGNYLLAATGTWISNPFTYIPLYLFNYRMGCLLLDKSSNCKELDLLSWGDVFDQGWIFSSRFFVGSMFVGSCMGFLTGITVYMVMKFLSKRRSPM